MILITGATGFVGRALVERLAADGLPVRILLPRAGRGHRQHEPHDWPGVEVAYGGLNDPEALHRAMTGVHTVFHLASAQWWGRRRDLEEVDLGGARNIIAAARSARIGRLVVLSHLGASSASAYTLLKIKGQVEETVKASGLSYTIFRSGVVFGPDDSFVNGIAIRLRANPVFHLLPGHGECLLHPIYVGDLVEALVQSLEHLDTVDQTISIGGPEYISLNEMVRTVMRVSRARRLLVVVPPYVVRSLSGLITRFIPYWPMTGQLMDMLASNRTAPMGTLYEYFSILPVRFEDTLVKYMRGRRYSLEYLRILFRRRSPHRS